ncbi:MAG: ATP synthase F1 subunit epsilon [Firmicutes bacterium HGW-Firmicutes-10]|jgi:F-type H+-transporting ATPase subunit epsilon|nr:ATP synthase F1 subunit epsilon [Erysipelothrix sp.]PKM69716.1 MAG: ATP synthase F1 subunit epsilon [Firmicutes bacterium HGW-Firmicutes-19]PKM88380.1 MAG: ATP synthase F1 subunit epsilon [Firmicutes bacterium HGW-Firmicutes-10]
MFTVRIVTPRGLYREFNTSILNVVSTEGQLGILRNHMPLVAILMISMLTTVEEDGRHRYAISGGTLYFKDNVATIMTDAVERSDEIDIERAQRAKQRAEERIKTIAEEQDLIRAQIALQRALNRINTAK